MSENQVMAQAVKTFCGEEGPKNPASAPFPVSRARFADLAANGLVVESAGIASAPESESSDGVGDTSTSDAAAQAESKPGRKPKAQ